MWKRGGDSALRQPEPEKTHFVQRRSGRGTGSPQQGGHPLLHVRANQKAPFSVCQSKSSVVSIEPIAFLSSNLRAFLLSKRFHDCSSE